MPGYQTHIHTLRLGGSDYRIRSLTDTQQFADPDALASDAGISSAQWSLFGHLWPAGRALAEHVAGFDVAGKRVLEIGCGLGLASLVLRQRGADITASDHHPLAEVFLAYNAALNDLPSVPYRRLRWDVADASLGRFDLIIGSDLLYERGHAALLSAMLAQHAAPTCDVLIVDPGRGNSPALTRALRRQGFAVSEERVRLNADEAPPFRGRRLHFHRDGDDRRGPVQ